MKNCKLLKSDNDYKDLRFSKDQTPLQSKLYMNVKSELNRRISNGESGLGIQYNNSTPYISKVKK